jgi:hypothetical protein
MQAASRAHHQHIMGKAHHLAVLPSAYRGAGKPAAFRRAGCVCGQPPKLLGEPPPLPTKFCNARPLVMRPSRSALDAVQRLLLDTSPS